MTQIFQSTLPRRERHTQNGGKEHEQNFNPRSHEGSDSFFLHPFRFPRIFQSTLPRRERLLPEDQGDEAETISIHAPTKGATSDASTAIVDITLISIHAPTKGATLSLRLCIPALSISIHAPTKGATISVPSGFTIFIISIHAPTKGATLNNLPVF